MNKSEKKPKKRNSKPRTKKPKENKIEKVLIENFVSLQKVMTGLSEKFGELSKNINELLKLFEDSAKILVKKEFELNNKQEPTKIDNKEMLNKIDQLIDQNRIIARGLTMIHESPRKEITQPQQSIQPINMNQQRRPISTVDNMVPSGFKRQVIEGGEEEPPPRFEIP